ncbi:MAG: DCC1-like thiol-disulfide oxidoreductase family protein [Gammaproteobacteria bacterium]|nr:DCC1-like thiol-disulfide oxidoreductase family protein [Gammaproteobacteria bacterium]
MPESLEQPVILFDGVCKFCHASVRFVIQRDNRKRFRFCPLQSSRGRQLVKQYSVENSGLTSMILLQDNTAYRKSGAALRIARRLRMPWPLLYVFIVVPPFLRDAVYDFIGNHRYQWFGKFDQCWIPDDETQKRFLD